MSVCEISEQNQLPADEIPWHPAPMAYETPSRPLTYCELWSVTQIEAVLETLTATETAGWVLGLICDKASLSATLHAAMDALHQLQHRSAR
jgi:hypothetical protein